MQGWTELRRMHVGEALDMCVWQRKNRFVLSSVWTAIDDESIAAYCRAHTEFFHAYLADVATRPAKYRVALVYDVRGLTVAPTHWMAAVIPFVSCHNALRECYKLHLHSTTILLSPGVVHDLLQTLFSTVYQPERPVHFVADEACVSNVYKELQGS